MQQRDSKAGAAAPEGALPELATSLDWPPLILPMRLPRLTRARDLTLTLLAWLACAVVLRKPIVNLIAWASPSLGSRLRAHIPIDYAIDTSPFLWIASGLVVILILSGIRRRHDLRRVPSADQNVPPLPNDVQFDGAGVPITQLGGWRSARCLHVRHSRDGRMMLVEKDETTSFLHCEP